MVLYLLCKQLLVERKTERAMRQCKILNCVPATASEAPNTFLVETSVNTNAVTGVLSFAPACLLEKDNRKQQFICNISLIINICQVIFA